MMKHHATSIICTLSCVALALISLLTISSIQSTVSTKTVAVQTSSESISSIPDSPSYAPPLGESFTTETTLTPESVEASSATQLLVGGVLVFTALMLAYTILRGSRDR